MASRQRSRQRALQILYLLDMRGQSVDEAIQSFYASLASEEAQPLDEQDIFAEQLIRGAVEHRDELDQRIAANSEHWRLDRMAVVDRNILRLAVYEMMHEKTPPPVVIDQALEMASRFSSPESIKFLNGVLDAIHQKMLNTAPGPE
jgi:transcription antitermination protein NusB